MEKANTESESGVFNYKTLSAYLKVAEGTLRHWVMQRRIPFTKAGMKVLFPKNEIDLWLRENTRGSRLAVERQGKAEAENAPRLFSDGDEGGGVD